MILSAQKELKFLVRTHLELIYPDADCDSLTAKLINIMALDECNVKPDTHANSWSESDVWLITYGDSIVQEGEHNLKTLHQFLNQHLSDVISGVHILPFFPYSSDDGFSVINYSQVNPALGQWSDIEAIASDYDLMSDLVINHCSSRSRWFDNFKQCISPGKDYFFEANIEDDLSAVIRPRTSPLLKEVETTQGTKHVWCTFSHDQIDLNFANPEVLCQMVEIIKFYLDKGVRIFRLDAVAFLWKEVGTNCLHLPQTHEIIRLLRTLVEHHSNDIILITETNVPNHENLSYFGNANEAHAIYNFSLPPLVLQALVKGTCQHLKAWQMTMPQAQMGTFYFNFLASHDGIGLRPAEGLLSTTEIEELVGVMQNFGARISWRATDAGQQKPYEINVSLIDAMQGTVDGKDNYQRQRFLCAHAIMLALEGIPAFYIHSLLATPNYEAGIEHTGQNRTINRYKWPRDTLQSQLNNQHSQHTMVMNALKKLINIRRSQPAFHPNALQFTLHITDEIFGFWRQSDDRKQRIFCLFNVSNKAVRIPLSSLNLTSVDSWFDMILGTEYSDIRQEVEFKPYQYKWITNKQFT